MTIRHELAGRAVFEIAVSADGDSAELLINRLRDAILGLRAIGLNDKLLTGCLSCLAGECAANDGADYTATHS